MQVKSTQVETKFPALQDLVTNLAYKLKPHQIRIKYLRARIDICAVANILPLHVYKLIFKDPDCEQLASSNKAATRTYTTDKINIVESCSLFMVHPDTRSLKLVTFYVTSHEGSVVFSCVTGLQLSLVQPHNNLENSIPSSTSLISSKVNYPKKRSQEIMQSQCCFYGK